MHLVKRKQAQSCGICFDFPGHLQSRKAESIREFQKYVFQARCRTDFDSLTDSFVFFYSPDLCWPFDQVAHKARHHREKKGEGVFPAFLGPDAL